MQKKFEFYINFFWDDGEMQKLLQFHSRDGIVEYAVEKNTNGKYTKHRYDQYYE